MSEVATAVRLRYAGTAFCTALLFLVCLPGSASGQNPDGGVGFAITPFAGYRLEYTRESDEVIDIGAEDLRRESREEISAGALTAGAELRAPLWRQFGLVGSLTYSFPADRTFRQVSEVGVPRDSLAGTGESILVKAGIAYRFLDRDRARRVRPMQAGISIAPALLRRYPADQSTGDPIDHWAVAISADASTGFGSSGMNVYAAVEDYVTFWNVQEMADRRAREISEQFPLAPRTQVQIETDPSHLILLRLGLSYTF